MGFLKSDNLVGPHEFNSPSNQDQALEARRFEVTEGRKMLLIRDITDLNRLLTMRQNFIANVSHELRTPLTVTQGYMEALTDTDLSHEEREDLVKRLESPLARMKSLVDDLLLLTRLESSPTPSQMHPIKLKQIVSSVAQELKSLMGHPDHLTLDLQADGDVLGISGELHSVVVNLLSNAIRYSSDAGNIHVELTQTPESVRLAITDDGVGIAPEHIQHITERFYRVDMADSRKRGGTRSRSRHC